MRSAEPGCHRALSSAAEMRMTIKATVWAMALRDVSPVAELAAIYISDNFDETTGRPSRPLSVSKMAEFSGKRGLIYRTGSFAKGTIEAARLPRCLANAKQLATYKGRGFLLAARADPGLRC
jgi:hypothetical protein